MQETTNHTEDLTEGWFVPFSGSRRYAHYLRDGNWLCGAKNWIPALAIRALMKNTSHKQCPKCKRNLLLQTSNKMS